VFWLSVVVGLAILVAVIVVVPESGVKTRGRFDLLVRCCCRPLSPACCW